MDKIWYEPHPVTPERKAELRAQGYRIVDVEFAPADWVEASFQGVKDAASGMPEAPAKRGPGRPRKDSEQ